MNTPLSFLVVGSGWRSRFYARIAQRYQKQFYMIAMLCRTEDKAAIMRNKYHILATSREQDCIDRKPDFVVVAVDKASMYEVTKYWVMKGFPVLCETPAGCSLEQLKELWKLKVKHGAKIQVAEQYYRYPMLAAGLKQLQTGRLGEPYAVSLSLAHDYHGASLIRRMLGIGMEPVTMYGSVRNYPVQETDSRDGAITDGSVKMHGRQWITMEFADGKLAQYDFSGVQYHSFIRSRHLNVQGQNGEWNDTYIRYVDEEHQPHQDMIAFCPEEKYQALTDSQVEEKIGSWGPVLTMDEWQDEYAIATILYDMGEYLETGRETYPLAESLEDAYIWLLMQQAVAEPDKRIVSEPMPWHGHEIGWKE